MDSAGLLEDARQRVSELMPKWQAAGFPVSLCYADERGGALVAGIPRTAPGDCQRYRELLGEQAGGVPVRLVPCGLARRHSPKNQFNRPLIGGLWTTAPLADGRFAQGTICVGADRAGQAGYVTAGHVADAVAVQFYQPRHSDHNNWQSGVVQVISGYAVRANSDSAFLADSTGGQITRNRIWKGNNAQYTVTGVVVPVPGTAVSMQGAAMAAERSGVICSAAATVTFDDGGILDNQYLATYRSRDGDSGAPVYVKGADPSVSLVGLNVGAAAPGDVAPAVNAVTYPPANNTYAVISPWAHVEADLGVTR
jgi:hypothetical protein